MDAYGSLMCVGSEGYSIWSDPKEGLMLLAMIERCQKTHVITRVWVCVVTDYTIILWLIGVTHSADNVMLCRLFFQCSSVIMDVTIAGAAIAAAMGPRGLGCRNRITFCRK